MRQTIFVAGASGAVGRRFLPLLVGNGHRVFGATRSKEKAEQIEAAGATPLIMDALDADAVMACVLKAAPTIVVHQLTDLAGGMDTDPESARVANARLRREATPNLVRAALAAGAKRLVAQSIAWAYAPGTPPYSEDHPLDLGAKDGRRTTVVDGIVPLEDAVLHAAGIEGIVLRYGQLYGPGTWTATPEGSAPLHVDAAAYAAYLAMLRGAPGAYNIADKGGDVSIEKAILGLAWSPDFRLG